MNEERANQLTGGVALVGFGLLFATGIGFWPNILLVLAAVSVTQALTEGKRWYAAQGALGALAGWAFFAFDQGFWVIMIIVGISMIFGKSIWDNWWDDDEVDKDEEGFGTRRTDLIRKRKMDELEDDERITYVVGDDGELVPEDEYVSAKRKNR